MQKFWCCWCDMYFDNPPTCHSEIAHYISFEFDYDSPKSAWEQMHMDKNARTHFKRSTQGNWNTTDPLLAFASDQKGRQCEWNEVIPQMELYVGDLVYIDGNTWEGFLSEVLGKDDSWVIVNVRYTPPKRGSDLNKQFRVRRSSVSKVVRVCGS